MNVSPRMEAAKKFAETFDCITPKTYEEWRAITLGDFFIHYELRTKHISTVGFPIHTLELLEALATHFKGRKVADVCCGAGYLVKQMQDRGINIVGFDNFDTAYHFDGTSETFKARQHCTVIEEDTTTIDLSGYDVIIMSWPDLKSNFAEVIASKMKVGQFLLYQGEGKYGCTGNDAFHDILDSNFIEEESISEQLYEVHPQFPGLHDEWRMYRCVKSI